MGRLPTVGGDNNTWGTVLNDYLQQSLTSAGLLVTAATNPYTGTVNANLATSTNPGLVQLAGDLAGTYASPTLANVATAATIGGTSAVPVVTYDAKGRITTTSTVVPSMPGYIALDSFTGANDDALLTAAMTYASAQTYPPTIRLGNRAYTFALARTLYDGFRLEGPPGFSNAEKSAVNMTCQATITTSGTWLTASTGTNTWNLYIAGIAFKGSLSTQFMACSNSGLECALLRDLSFTAFKSILGSQATKMLLTACTFDGYWEVNNSYNGAFHLGGSDNTLWPNGMLLDSGTAFNTAGSATGQYHLWCDYLEKTSIGPLYITCEGPWGGIHITGPAYNVGGSNLGGPLWFTPGLRCEGRNSGAPCYGANIRVDGGIAIFNDSWISYGMSSPATMAHTPADAGIVHVTSGQVYLNGCTYDHATGVAESVPFMYLTAGNGRIYNQFVGSKTAVWTGLPRIHNGGSGAMANDTTVTVI